MTPLVIAIDPGTKQSAFVEWDGRFITNVGTKPNIEVLRYLRTVDRRACVVFEAIQNYGSVVGKSVHETSFWTGRLFQVARDTVGPSQVSRIKRSVVKKHLGLHQTMSDKEVKAALIRILEHNPIEWHNLRSHQFSALAIAVTWWNTERARQPLKGRKSAA